MRYYVGLFGLSALGGSALVVAWALVAAVFMPRTDLPHEEFYRRMRLYKKLFHPAIFTAIGVAGALLTAWRLS